MRQVRGQKGSHSRAHTLFQELKGAWSLFAKGRWRVFALAAIAPIAALASLEDALRDISVFSEALVVLRRAGARKAAYEAYLKAMDVEETPMSSAAVWAEMELLGNRLYFDRDGQLHLDDRFVLPEEHKTLYKAEEVFRRICEGGIAGIPPGVKISQVSKPGAAQTSSGGKGALPQLSKRAAETKPDAVPVFRGFEDARYQEHDSLNESFCFLQHSAVEYFLQYPGHSHHKKCLKLPIGCLFQHHIY